MAGGQQIDVGQGNVVYSELTEDVVTGSAATSDAGTQAPGTVIRLRSRKVGGGTSSFLLSGQFSTAQQETPIKEVAALLATPVTTGAQGSFTNNNARTLSGILVQITQTSIGDQGEEWDINAVTFTEGIASSVQLPVPSGYTVGGFYQVVTGTLPTGITLSDSGLLSYDGAGAFASASITFSYTEPGAISTLTLHSTSAGTFPYMATVYPAEGAVPDNYILLSPDDSTLRSNVLSEWPDGSAQIIVVAGHKAVSASSTTEIKLRPGAPSGTALTTAYIDSLLTSVAVNFGTALSFTNFTSGYDRIWWANSQVICARYRLPITNKGVMEAVIDVHAFANGRVFVEVVVENSRMNIASPSEPADQSYTSATVSVNGTTIATVSSSGGIGATHQAFRSWYCSGWVGGDPLIEVTHDTASMQAHPLFYKLEVASSANLQTLYQSDAYTPWNNGRISASMGGTGDHPGIGPLTTWDAHYLQSGSKYARRAVLASGLGPLVYNINYRDTGTNLVPTHTQLLGKSFALGFPGVGSGGFPTASAGDWEYAHQPAVGLMAFLCRPSPVFLEIAQKISAFCALGNNYGQGLFSYWYQIRGKAWCWRNLTHSTFLTPTSVDSNVTAWKTAAKTNMAANVTFFRLWDSSAEDKLNIMWSESASDADAQGQGAKYADHTGAGDGFQGSMWMHDWVSVETHKAHQAKILDGADQTNLGALADWALTQPCRWVNEQTNGGWRYIGYRTILGTADASNDVTMGQLNDWGAMRAWRNPTNPASVSGTWQTQGGNDPVTYLTGWGVENGNSGYLYVHPFWQALCAAVERGVSGAETAWSTVTTNVTNLTTFRNNAASEPRYIPYPRNK